MSFLPKPGRVDRSKEVPPIRLLMYAPGGFGKTYFASQWPDAIMANTDGNIVHTSLPGMIINRWEVPKNYKVPTADEVANGVVDLRGHSFISFVDELIRTNGAGFKTLILDLTEDIYQLCRLSKLEEFNLTHESDIPNGGKGYSIVRTPFYAAIDKLMSLPINIIMLSHEKEKIIKDRLGREFTYFQPNLDDAVLKKIAKTGYTLRGYFKPLEIDGNDSPQVVRMLSLSPKADEFQVTRFTDAEGNPIVLEDIELSYENFAEAMKGIKDPNNVGEFEYAVGFETGKSAKEAAEAKRDAEREILKKGPSSVKKKPTIKKETKVKEEVDVEEATEEVEDPGLAVLKETASTPVAKPEIKKPAVKKPAIKKPTAKESTKEESKPATTGMSDAKRAQLEALKKKYNK